MASPIPPVQNWEQETNDDNRITFIQSITDIGRIIVSCFRRNGAREILGYLYGIPDGDEIKYYATYRNGREMFPPTTDFNSVEKRFERHARLLQMERENDKMYDTINFLTKNINAMNKTNNTEIKSKKINQLYFLESEKPTKDGRFITVTDSYRNVLGRIDKTYNQELKKYEYQSFDHTGKPFNQSEKIWELKNDFINKREELLEQAHQRRIDSKEQAPEQSQNSKKADIRKNETEKIRQDKNVKEIQPIKSANDQVLKANVKSDELENPNSERDQIQEREEELEDLRDDIEEDRGDNDIER
jgi:hypothetical protein